MPDNLAEIKALEARLEEVRSITEEQTGVLSKLPELAGMVGAQSKHFEEFVRINSSLTNKIESLGRRVAALEGKV